MILKIVMLGLIIIPMFGTAFASLQEMESFLPDTENLSEDWQISPIQTATNIEIPGFDEKPEAVLKQFVLYDQNNNDSLLLSTLNIVEFSSADISSQMHESHKMRMLATSATNLNITDSTGSDCFGIIANQNLLNEASSVVCRVDEFVLISTTEQNANIYEEEQRVHTAKVSVSFVNFVIEKIQDQGKVTNIPNWIKTNAGWWADGLIGDSDFISGIQYLIENKIIIVPDTAFTSASSEEIPEWIKNNAGWWSKGMISNGEFINGIQHLVKIGIIDF